MSPQGQSELLKAWKSSLIGMWITNALLSLAVIGVVIVFGLAGSARDNKLDCTVRLLAGPWVALEKSFSSPPGDPETRKLVVKQLTKSIEKLKDVDNVCR